MDSNHLQELIDLEEDYWWHVAKRRLVLELLAAHFPAPGKIVEGGSGSSRNLIECRHLGYQIVGLDVMPEAVAYARQRGLSDVYAHDLVEPWPETALGATAVVLLDVLEHTKDPVAVLSHAACCLSSDGGIVVTVPAYPSLYSEWDRQLGHHCRYTTRKLTRQASEAGLDVVWMGHWNAFTLPAAAIRRGVGSLFHREGRAEFPRVPPWVNRTLLRCAAIERWFLRRIGVPFGLSLVSVLRRRGAGSC